MDSAKCHLTQKEKEKLAEIDVEHSIIPPRMTNLIQPADQMWFSIIKRKYQQKLNDW